MAQGDFNLHFESNVESLTDKIANEFDSINGAFTQLHRKLGAQVKQINTVLASIGDGAGNPADRILATIGLEEIERIGETLGAKLDTAINKAIQRGFSDGLKKIGLTKVVIPVEAEFKGQGAGPQGTIRVVHQDETQSRDRGRPASLGVSEAQIQSLRDARQAMVDLTTYVRKTRDAAKEGTSALESFVAQLNNIKRAVPDLGQVSAAQAADPLGGSALEGALAGVLAQAITRAGTHAAKAGDAAASAVADAVADGAKEGAAEAKKFTKTAVRQNLNELLSEQQNVSDMMDRFVKARVDMLRKEKGALLQGQLTESEQIGRGEGIPEAEIQQALNGLRQEFEQSLRSRAETEAKMFQGLFDPKNFFAGSEPSNMQDLMGSTNRLFQEVINRVKKQYGDSVKAQLASAGFEGSALDDEVKSAVNNRFGFQTQSSDQRAALVAQGASDPFQVGSFKDVIRKLFETAQSAGLLKAEFDSFDKILTRVEAKQEAAGNAAEKAGDATTRDTSATADHTQATEQATAASKALTAAAERAGLSLVDLAGALKQVQEDRLRATRTANEAGGDGVKVNNTLGRELRANVERVQTELLKQINLLVRPANALYSDDGKLRPGQMLMPPDVISGVLENRIGTATPDQLPALAQRKRAFDALVADLDTLSEVWGRAGQRMAGDSAARKRLLTQIADVEAGLVGRDFRSEGEGRLGGLEISSPLRDRAGELQTTFDQRQRDLGLLEGLRSQGIRIVMPELTDRPIPSGKIFGGIINPTGQAGGPDHLGLPNMVPSGKGTASMMLNSGASLMFFPEFATQLKDAKARLESGQEFKDLPLAMQNALRSLNDGYEAAVREYNRRVEAKTKLAPLLGQLQQDPTFTAGSLRGTTFASTMARQLDAMTVDKFGLYGGDEDVMNRHVQDVLQNGDRGALVQNIGNRTVRTRRAEAILEEERSRVGSIAAIANDPDAIDAMVQRMGRLLRSEDGRERGASRKTFQTALNEWLFTGPKEMVGGDGADLEQLGRMRNMGGRIAFEPRYDVSRNEPQTAQKIRDLNESISTAFRTIKDSAPGDLESNFQDVVKNIESAVRAIVGGVADTPSKREQDDQRRREQAAAVRAQADERDNDALREAVRKQLLAGSLSMGDVLNPHAARLLEPLNTAAYAGEGGRTRGGQLSRDQLLWSESLQTLRGPEGLAAVSGLNSLSRQTPGVASIFSNLELSGGLDQLRNLNALSQASKALTASDVPLLSKQLVLPIDESNARKFSPNPRREGSPNFPLEKSEILLNDLASGKAVVVDDAVKSRVEAYRKAAKALNFKDADLGYVDNIIASMVRDTMTSLQRLVNNLLSQITGTGLSRLGTKLDPVSRATNQQYDLGVQLRGFGEGNLPQFDTSGPDRYLRDFFSADPRHISGAVEQLIQRQGLTGDDGTPLAGLTKDQRLQLAFPGGETRPVPDAPEPTAPRPRPRDEAPSTQEMLTSALSDLARDADKPASRMSRDALMGIAEPGLVQQYLDDPEHRARAEALRPAVRDGSITPLDVVYDQAGKALIEDGHHRLAAAALEGVNSLPVRRYQGDLGGQGRAVDPLDSLAAAATSATAKQAGAVLADTVADTSTSAANKIIDQVLNERAAKDKKPTATDQRRAAGSEETLRLLEQRGLPDVAQLIRQGELVGATESLRERGMTMGNARDVVSIGANLSPEELGRFEAELRVLGATAEGTEDSINRFVRNADARLAQLPQATQEAAAQMRAAFAQMAAGAEKGSDVVAKNLNELIAMFARFQALPGMAALDTRTSRAIFANNLGMGWDEGNRVAGAWDTRRQFGGGGSGGGGGGGGGGVPGMSGGDPFPELSRMAAQPGGKLGEALFGKDKSFLDRQLRSFGYGLTHFFDGMLIYSGFYKFKEMIKDAFTIDREFVRIKDAMPGMSDGEMEGLRTDMTKISNDTGVPLLDVVKTAAGFTGVFNNKEDLTAATRASNNLMMISGGRLNHEEVRKAMSAVATSFRNDERYQGPQGLDRIADLATTVQNVMGVNVEDTLEGVGRLGSSSELTKIDPVLSASLVGTLVKTLGLTGMEATEPLTRIIETMGRGASRKLLVPMLEGKGVKGVREAYENNDMGFIFENLIELMANDQMSASEIKDVQGVIAPGRQGATFAAMFSNPKELFRAWRQIEGTPDGAAADRVDELSNAPLGIWQRLGVSLENLITAIERSGALDGLTLFASALQKVTSGLSFLANTLSSIPILGTNILPVLTSLMMFKGLASVGRGLFGDVPARIADWRKTGFYGTAEYAAMAADAGNSPQRRRELDITARDRARGMRASEALGSAGLMGALFGPRLMDDVDGDEQPTRTRRAQRAKQASGVASVNLLPDMLAASTLFDGSRRRVFDRDKLSKFDEMGNFLQYTPLAFAGQAVQGMGERLADGGRSFSQGRMVNRAKDGWKGLYDTLDRRHGVLTPATKGLQGAMLAMELVGTTASKVTVGMGRLTAALMRLLGPLGAALAGLSLTGLAVGAVGIGGAIMNRSAMNAKGGAVIDGYSQALVLPAKEREEMLQKIVADAGINSGRSVKENFTTMDGLARTVGGGFSFLGNVGSSAISQIGSMFGMGQPGKDNFFSRGSSGVGWGNAIMEAFGYDTGSLDKRFLDSFGEMQRRANGDPTDPASMVEKQTLDVMNLLTGTGTGRPLSNPQNLDEFFGMQAGTIAPPKPQTPYTESPEGKKELEKRAISSLEEDLKNLRDPEWVKNYMKDNGVKTPTEMAAAAKMLSDLEQQVGQQLDVLKAQAAGITDLIHFTTEELQDTNRILTSVGGLSDGTRIQYASAITALTNNAAIPEDARKMVASALDPKATKAEAINREKAVLDKQNQSILFKLDNKSLTEEDKKAQLEILSSNLARIDQLTLQLAQTYQQQAALLGRKGQTKDAIAATDMYIAELRRQDPYGQDAAIQGQILDANKQKFDLRFRDRSMADGSRVSNAEGVAQVADAQLIQAQNNLSKAEAANKAVKGTYGPEEIQSLKDAVQSAKRAAAAATVQLADALSDLSVALAEERGDLTGAARERLNRAAQKAEEARNKFGKGSAEAASAEATEARARQQAESAMVGEQISDLDFQRQMGQISSNEYIKGLQAILNAGIVNKQTRQQLMLKIRGLQEELRNELTSSGFNIPTEIKLPSAFEVRRSLGLNPMGQQSSGSNMVTNTAVTNNTTVNNTVATPAMVEAVSQRVAELIATQTFTAARATQTTPALVRY